MGGIVSSTLVVDVSFNSFGRNLSYTAGEVSVRPEGLPVPVMSFEVFGKLFPEIDGCLLFDVFDYFRNGNGCIIFQQQMDMVTVRFLGYDFYSFVFAQGCCHEFEAVVQMTLQQFLSVFGHKDNMDFEIPFSSVVVVVSVRYRRLVFLHIFL